MQHVQKGDLPSACGHRLWGSYAQRSVGVHGWAGGSFQKREGVSELLDQVCFYQHGDAGNHRVI